MSKKLSLAILGVLMLFTFSACKKEEDVRKPISSDSFKLVGESDDYEITDVTESLNNNKGIMKALVARVKNKYQVEYYTLDDSEVAQKMYDRNKKRFESQKNDNDKAEIVETDNYSEYKLLTKGKYKLLCKIDNTLVYADVDEQYKDSVVEFAKQLGYLK